ATACRRLLAPERPCVALVAVDDDVEDVPGGAASRQRDRGPRLLGRARALPEDDLATTCAREHELRAILAGTGEHEVDGRATPDARAHGHALDDLQPVCRPLVGAVAVHLARPRPR